MPGSDPEEEESTSSGSNHQIFEVFRDKPEPPVRFNQVQMNHIMKQFSVYAAMKRDIPQESGEHNIGNLRKRLREVAHLLPVVDTWEDPDVWALIDDGANRTVHGKEWMDNALTKLARYGYCCPWQDSVQSRITGVGDTTQSSRQEQETFQFHSRY